MLRHELVRDVHVHAADRAERSGQDHQEVEAAGDLPTPEIAGCGGAPVVGREPRPARAIARAASTTFAADTPASARRTRVNCAYRSFSAAMNESNVSGSGRSARRDAAS